MTADENQKSESQHDKFRRIFKLGKWEVVGDYNMLPSPFVRSNEGGFKIEITGDSVFNAIKDLGYKDTLAIAKAIAALPHLLHAVERAVNYLATDEDTKEDVHRSLWFALDKAVHG